MNPRASRIALIVASVPELTSRTSSMLGMRSQSSLGQLGSRSRSACRTTGRAARLRTAVDDCGMRVAENQRAPRADVVDVALAVGIPEARALRRARRSAACRRRRETRAPANSRRPGPSARRRAISYWLREPPVALIHAKSLVKDCAVRGDRPGSSDSNSAVMTASASTPAAISGGALSSVMPPIAHDRAVERRARRAIQREGRADRAGLGAGSEGAAERDVIGARRERRVRQARAGYSTTRRAACAARVAARAARRSPSVPPRCDAVGVDCERELDRIVDDQDARRARGVSARNAAACAMAQAVIGALVAVLHDAGAADERGAYLRDAAPRVVGVWRDRIEPRDWMGHFIYRCECLHWLNIDRSCWSCKCGILYDRAILPEPRSPMTEAAPMKTYMCLICGWIYEEETGRPEDGIAAGHALGGRADELDLPGVRRAQGRFRDGRNLTVPSAKNVKFLSQCFFAIA